MSDFDFQTFVKDRDEAILSLDPAKIRAYAAKYDTPCPGDDEVVIAGAHKAITALTHVSEETKALSRKWLSDRGLSSFD
jgi:hypothetical protein